MDALRAFETLSRFPFGKRVFSRAFCFMAPYFGTIRPLFTELQPGLCVVKMRDRRRVRNHLGTVHAIAMCNMAEAAGGLCVEVSVPRGLRWIPKKMEVEYLQKAKGDLTATCRFDPGVLAAGECAVPVDVADVRGEIVFRARITMYLSERK
jgi:acyl-coenzyme A thioesterase PaaI-like protein